ncbi:cytochrome c [Rhodobacteraceae bacterium S2214]|nr:cytochrome c [Rhodobacteraceae bacterium S2214]
MNKSTIACITAVIVSIGGVAISDGHISDEQIEAAVKARKAHMQLYSFNLATLGGMAKEEIPYDAEAASAAADNLVALSQVSQAGYWLPGSDSASVEGSRALPAIWEAGSDIGQKGADFAAAALAMQAAARTDLAALKAGMGGLGESCGGCHKPYRAPRN